MPTDACDSAEDQVDKRCDAFEQAWRGGQRPKISDFLLPEDRVLRAQMFRELLLVDLEYRRLNGEQPKQKDYLLEFSEFAPQIEAIGLQYRDVAFSASPTRREGNSAADTLQPGEFIAHFELVKLLGLGAMGAAWKAWDSRLRRHVTLKVPHGLSLAENDLRRFLREGQSGAQLQHAQLASVHDVGRDGEIYYLVANYIDGRNLREFVRERPLTFQEIAILCAEIAKALHHVHAKGLIHRDLKPANIIVDSSGSPHIIDFGLAKFLDDDHDLTMHGELVGTPAYMSPEQANGIAAQMSFRSDIYSLGVILFELITGKCPFKGDRESVIRQILVRDPPRPRTIQVAIPRDLETICLKAIEKDPGRRYSTALEFAGDLHLFADGKPVLARRTNLAEKCGRLALRRPAITAIFAIGLIALVIGSSALSSLHKRNRRLEGFRPVHITSEPSGAHVVLVPIDPDTNEPVDNVAEFIRPSGKTPLTVEAKAGRYLLEAELTGSSGPMFTEVYRTVAEISRQSEASTRANIKTGLDPETCRLSSITLKPIADLTSQMVKIRIDDESRRQNPLLPEILYVDAQQTLPNEGDSPNAKFGTFLSKTALGEPCITYQGAVDWAEQNHKRLPSSAEYDAIMKAIERGDVLQPIHDLSDERPEYTTTIMLAPAISGNAVTNHLYDMHILKGCGDGTSLPEIVKWADGTLLAPHDCKSEKIGIRGVRSGTPRFLIPH
jgi:eukaryotic-like serine/threonine-protein kinase